MEIIISNSSDKPIYEQIAMQIKSLIMNGTLSAGEALPSMRALAKDLHISCLLYTSQFVNQAFRKIRIILINITFFY